VIIILDLVLRNLSHLSYNKSFRFVPFRFVISLLESNNLLVSGEVITSSDEAILVSSPVDGVDGTVFASERVRAL